MQGGACGLRAAGFGSCGRRGDSGALPSVGSRGQCPDTGGGSRAGARARCCPRSSLGSWPAGVMWIGRPPSAGSTGVQRTRHTPGRPLALGRTPPTQNKAAERVALRPGPPGRLTQAGRLSGCEINFQSLNRSLVCNQNLNICGKQIFYTLMIHRKLLRGRASSLSAPAGSCAVPRRLHVLFALRFLFFLFLSLSSVCSAFYHNLL